MADEVDKLTLGAVEDILRGLLPDGDGSALHLSFRHAESFSEAVSGDGEGWVSESERDKALGLDGVWTLVLTGGAAVHDHVVRRASSLAALFPARAEASVG